MSSRWSLLAEVTRSEQKDELRERLNQAGLRSEVEPLDGSWKVSVPSTQLHRAHGIFQGTEHESTLRSLPEVESSAGDSLQTHLSRFLVPLGVVVLYILLAIVLVAGFGWLFG